MKTATAHFDEDGVVTIAEAAHILSVSRSEIYKLMDGRLLGYTRVGRDRRIPRKEIARYLDSGFVPPA